MTFEESIKKLEEMSDKIRDDKTTLDEAVQYIRRRHQML